MPKGGFTYSAVLRSLGGHYSGSISLH